MFDPTGAQSPSSGQPSFDRNPPPHVFVDVDGVEWKIEWCDADAVRRRVPDATDPAPGLVFTAKDAMVFHLPMRLRLDPRVLTSTQLNSMVDRAYD